MAWNGQMSGQDDTGLDFAADGQGAAQQVYQGIMQDLEARRIVPGQRLVETDLAQTYGVGRNAVREAIQRLSARGIVDLSRNRSPAIRRLDLAEVHEILDVAAAMTGLVAQAAARAFAADRHAAQLAAAMAQLESASHQTHPGQFSRARRSFYRTLLDIGGNRELRRLFPSIGMHIIYSQLQSLDMQSTRLADYRLIAQQVVRKDPAEADRAAREHVANTRAMISALDFA